MQCRGLEDLPWGEVSGGEDTLLLVPRSVQEEIDRLKQDGNKRRSKRARKANSFIRQIVFSENYEIIIRDSEPKVVASFSPLDCQRQNESGVLDLSRPDDRIIQEALDYRAVNPDKEVKLLTHDTNPMLTAKRCGLTFTVIPDSWLLPPQQDTRDKRIAELEHRLKKLESTHPQIEIFVEDERDAIIESLAVTVTTYEPLSEGKLEEIIAEVKTRYPLVNDFEEAKKVKNDQNHLMFGILRRYQPPRKEEIEKYSEFKYPKWLNEVSKFLINLPNRLESPGRYVDINFVIENSGTVPAGNVVVEFWCEGGLLFGPPRSGAVDGEKLHDLRIPAPPQPPKGKWIQRGTSTLLLDSMIGKMSRPNYVSPLMDFRLPLIPKAPEPRNRNDFYWKTEVPSASKDTWVFECEEFRHQVDSEIFPITIFIPPNIIIKKGVIKCRVTSKNLPNPVRYNLPVQVRYVEGDTMKKAHVLLERIN